MQFSTPEVSALHEQVKGWDHPEYPFLDPLYSPGSYAPAIDLTPAFASWLALGKNEPIQELWSLLTPDGAASTYALKKGMSATFPSWLSISDWQRNELRAINLLSIRASMSGRPDETVLTSTKLAACTLACENIKVGEENFSDLVRASKNEVSEEQLGLPRADRETLAAEAITRVQEPISAEAPAIERLKLIAPMTRQVITDYFSRNWAQGLLRLELYYGDRMYGCSKNWNNHFINWTEFFQPPDDNARVPSVVTKAILSDALKAAGVQTKKIEKRSSLIEIARKTPGLLASLIISVYPEQQQVREEWRPSLTAWSERCAAVEPVASGILKLLKLSTLRG